MRIVGIKKSDGPVLVGSLSDDGTEVAVMDTLEGFWASPAKHLAQVPSGPVFHVGPVTLVPPVPQSARVVCMGLNYQDHVNEGSFRDEELPEFPTLFARWPTSLSTDGAAIPIPSGEDGLDWEGEVVAWVGSRLVDATPEEALAAVVGYSTFNDITSRRAQKRTSQWIMGKNGDRSGPIGPMVPASEVGDLVNGLRVETRVNGQVVQCGSTAQMIYGVGETLAHISRSFTINPGDLLATGTPAGVGYARTPPWLLNPGDVVEVEVEKLGVLTNHIVDNLQRHVR
ncbi:fumarylacetoacetate hydrolase family protein [Arthrobacter psychrochitiniphilus]|uniref:fumarylacetoacetate hydrolase family protein n=1 Tax=Arthrobacter psychrochitiniphilus TaxID=291045 RepID=UPI003F7B9D84